RPEPAQAGAEAYGTLPASMPETRVSGAPHLDLSSYPLAAHLGRVFAARDFPLHLVGGSVRSVLLGLPAGDLDFTTRARPADFTINALAADALTGELVDLHGGERDLAARLIRAVGDPHSRFAEDPLRLMRAVRLAAQLDFRIEGATAEAVAQQSAALQTISRE